MTRIIACSSGKGGAGKTTLVVNLGAALTQIGRDVIVLDANLTTPNVGLHLGLPLYPTTLHDVLKGRNNIKDAIFPHENGMKVIPAGISIRDLRGADPRDLQNSILDLLGHAEIILLDSAAGLGREALAAIESADEMLLITNPDLPSVTDALKAQKLAEEMGTKVIGAAVNKYNKRRHQLPLESIEKLLDTDIIASIPADINVQKSLAKRIPIVYDNPWSPASIEIMRLAGQLIGREINIKTPLHQRLFSFFR